MSSSSSTTTKSTTATTTGVSKKDLCDRYSHSDGVFSICGNMDNKSDISIDKLAHKTLCNNSINLNEMNGNGSKSKMISKNSIRNGSATKSVGTQYTSVKRINNSNDKSEKIPDRDIVVISNEFRDNALNQQCLIDSKRKILKLLKSRKNIDWRSLDDMRPDPISTNNNQSPPPPNGSLTNGTKTVLSKSDSLVASVELVFIPDECLQETPKKVYILKDTAPGLNSKILSKMNGNDAERKEIFFISDGFRKNSLKNSTVIVEDEPRRRHKPLKYLKHSVQQSSVDDVNNKMVSQAFHSYDEEDGNLEKKELKNGSCRQ